MSEPSDLPTFVNYFTQQRQKMNGMEGSRLVFADLTSEQIATSFLMSTPPERRQQLIDEIHYGVLFETASWLASNKRQGCIKCAPFLSRQMLQAYPARPLQLLSGEQIPSFYHREQAVAYNILKQVVENPEQKNFVSFVGREHLLNVAKHLTMFINDQKLF